MGLLCISSESEIRYTQRQIKSDLTFDRQRLQRYRAAAGMRSASGEAARHLPREYRCT